MTKINLKTTQKFYKQNINVKFLNIWKLPFFNSWIGLGQQKILNVNFFDKNKVHPLKILTSTQKFYKV